MTHAGFNIETVSKIIESCIIMCIYGRLAQPAIILSDQIYIQFHRYMYGLYESLLLENYCG